MARFAPRLGFHTSGEEEPVWELMPALMREICSPDCFGQQLSQDAQSNLDSICRRYLLLRQAEQSASLFAEALAAKDRLHCAVSDFIKLSEGSLFSEDEGNANSDARRLVQSLFFDGLESASILLEGRDMEPPCLDPALSDGGKPVGELSVGTSFLMRLSQVLRIALGSVDANLEGFKGGFTPGDAFKSFLSELTDWGKAEGFAVNAGNDAAPSPFVSLIVALDNSFPAPFRQDDLNTASMVRRLNRHRAEQAQIPSGQIHAETGN